MSKKILKAHVTVPELPRVRFMRKAAPGSPTAFIDVTCQVAEVVIETQVNDTEACALVRLDEKGELVWRTLHPSLDETQEQARHEYQLDDTAWLPCE